MKKQGRKQFLNEDNVSSRCSFLNGCSDDWTVLLFLKIIFDAFDKLTTMFFIISFSSLMGLAPQ